eukprot:scaffold139595_cov124-Phaeocystis_antarctica.AAC.1
MLASQPSTCTPTREPLPARLSPPPFSAEQSTRVTRIKSTWDEPRDIMPPPREFSPGATQLEIRESTILSTPSSMDIAPPSPLDSPALQSDTSILENSRSAPPLHETAAPRAPAKQCMNRT